MNLLNVEAYAEVPKLLGQEYVKDPIVYVKFFTPTNWIWYANEFDGRDRFFGWICSLTETDEFGYFSLQELQQVRTPWSLGVERDLYFKPKPLFQLLNC